MLSPGGAVAGAGVRVCVTIPPFEATGATGVAGRISPVGILGPGAAVLAGSLQVPALPLPWYSPPDDAQQRLPEPDP